MRRPFLVLAILCASTIGARSDSGTFHRCQVEGEGVAEVYETGDGRHVSFMFAGKSYDLPAQGARFSFHAAGRSYSFDPHFHNPPAVLTITTPRLRKVVYCDPS